MPHIYAVVKSILTQLFKTHDASSVNITTLTLQSVQVSCSPHLEYSESLVRRQLFRWEM